MIALRFERSVYKCVFASYEASYDDGFDDGVPQEVIWCLIRALGVHCEY